MHCSLDVLLLKFQNLKIPFSFLKYNYMKTLLRMLILRAMFAVNLTGLKRCYFN